MSKAFVYLIHLDHPLAHARHYIGYTSLESVEDRVDRHKRGDGARMLQVCNQNGIKYEVVRVWAFEGDWSACDARKLERKLKRLHNGKKVCPVCQKCH